MARVIVTGATGLIGKALCKALIERGDEVIVFSRDPEAARQKVPHATDYIAWGGAEQGVWAASIDGADAVVNLGAVSLFAQRWSDSFKREIRDSRVIGTRGIVNAIAQAKSKPAVLVNASAVGIYGPHGHEKLDEDAPPGNDFLAEVCKAWEAEARKAEAKHAGGGATHWHRARSYTRAHCNSLCCRSSLALAGRCCLAHNGFRGFTAMTR